MKTSPIHFQAAYYSKAATSAEDTFAHMVAKMDADEKLTDLYSRERHTVDGQIERWSLTEDELDKLVMMLNGDVGCLDVLERYDRTPGGRQQLTAIVQDYFKLLKTIGTPILNPLNRRPYNGVAEASETQPQAVLQA